MATGKPHGSGGSKRGAVSARQKAQAFRLAEQRRARRRHLAAIIAALVVVAGIVVGVAISLGSSGGSAHAKSTPTDSMHPTSSSASSNLGPEGIPLEQGAPLASASGAASGGTVDGIQCNPDEQVVYHIHAHLAVYVNGALRPIPPGIGIVEPVGQAAQGGTFYQATRCYYWLHVHAQDGVIHIEAPSRALYTLGQFFAIWRQPLTTSDVAGATGTQTVYVDGKRYTGSPASIQLKPHEDIQIDVGTDVAPKSVDWSTSQL